MFARFRFRIGKLKKNLKRGLTLVEMAVVLLVLAIIMGIVYANVDFGITDDARKLAIKNSSKTLPFIVEKYQNDGGTLSAGESLQALSQKKIDLPGYRPADPDALKDPWGNFYFVCSGKEDAAICSFGSDGKMGGEGKAADFVLTEPESWPDWLQSKR